jgi:anti-sigma factor (TIGR02949 family)
MSDREMTCEEAIRLLVDYLDGELEADRRGELDRHLSICRSCFSRHEFEKGLKERVAELGQEPVPPEFQDRIRALVSRFAGADAGGRPERA